MSRRKKVKGARLVLHSVSSVFNLLLWPKCARTSADDAPKKTRHSVSHATVGQTANRLAHPSTSIRESHRRTGSM